MQEQQSYNLNRQDTGSSAYPSYVERMKTLRESARADFEFTWEQALRVLKKNARLGQIVAGVALLLALLIVGLMQSTYQPTARIEIAPPASGVRTLHEVESPADAENQDYLETQAQILKSDALAVSVIRQLQLDKDLRFREKNSAAPAVPFNALANRVGSLNKPYFKEQIELATLGSAEAEALEIFHRQLSVSPVHNTRLVEVSFSSHDPQVAQQVTNAVVARFIENGIRQRYDSTTQASEWLSQQLEGLRQKVLSARQAVSDYQREHDLVELDDRDVPLAQIMSETNHQLSEAQATRIENEAYLRMLKVGDAENVPSVRTDPVYQDLLLRRDDLRTKLAQARTVYGDANSNVKKLEEQLAELDRQREEERSRIGDRIRTAFAASQERERLMLQQREKVRVQMVKADSHMVGYHILKNEAVANAELYNTLQARLKEAGIYAGLGSNNIRIIDLAQNLRKPTGPHRVALMGAGALFSVLLGVFACFFKESLNNTLRTPDDVRTWVGLKSLALLPAMPLGGSDRRWPHGSAALPETIEEGRAGNINFMSPQSAEAEAIRELRTAILSRKAKNGATVILISSAMEAEGKTTVAVNLAIALAQLGPTCLIDADLRKSMVATAFAMPASPGLSEVLSGTAPVSTALANVVNIPGLRLLPAGSAVRSPADQLASASMDQLCGDLVRSNQFEFLVIDTAPIIYFADARQLARLADEVVIVGRYGLTTRRAIQRSAELLQDVKASIAGVVLNGVDYTSPDYLYFTYGYRDSGSAKNTYAQLYSRSLQSVETASAESSKRKGAHA